MSCWDTTACLKTLCTAYNDFQKSPCDETIKDLQRQIDVIIGVTSHGASLQDLSPKQLLYAESLSVLVSVINEPNLKNPLYLKSITALSQLAHDQETKEALQTTFNLVVSLVSFLLRLQSNSPKQLYCQTLNLLEKLTYQNTRPNISSPQLFELLKVIIKKIQSSSPDQCLPSLGILANLIRKNIEVQAHVKSLSEIKSLNKTLLKYLSHSNKAYSVTSLSILTSPILDEDTRDKIFSGSNLLNIIHLVFQSVVTAENITTIQYAVDLIIDLLSHSKTYKIISESNQLYETYILRIFISCTHSTDHQTATKVFELFNALCSKSATRRKLVQLLLKHCSPDEETQMPDDSNTSPLQGVLHWMVNPSMATCAMQFAKEVINECVVHLEGGEKLQDYFLAMVPICLENLSTSLKADDEKLLVQRCRRLASSLEVLNSLVKHSITKQAILHKLDVQHLSMLVETVYKEYADDLKAGRSPTNECSDELIHVIFRSFELLVALKNDLASGNEIYAALLQDGQLLPFLSRGFASTSKYLVHASLQIFAEALKHRGFQITSLGDNITSINTCKHAELTSLKNGRLPEADRPPHQPVVQYLSQPLGDITNMKSSEGNITALTEKLRKGLDVKDSKFSDIMDYYEHKLAALTGRERHLEDVIEAKTQALSQSDRLLSQFRCRQAQADAECLKLRTLLQQSERKCETDLVRMDEYLKTKESLEKEISRLKEEVSGYEQDSMKHKELKYKYQEQSQKLETVQKSLVAAEEENHSLAAMNDCLHKNSEKLKSKLECSNERIKLIEGEVKKINSELKDREDVINERNELLKKAELKSQEKLNEITTITKQKKDLEKKLQKTEKNVQESLAKISTLERLCSSHEANIKEKDDQIQQLQDDVEKHAQITAMINNLTSGRMNPSK